MHLENTKTKRINWGAPAKPKHKKRTCGTPEKTQLVKYGTTYQAMYLNI